MYVPLTQKDFCDTMYRMLRHNYINIRKGEQEIYVSLMQRISATLCGECYVIIILM